MGDLGVTQKIITTIALVVFAVSLIFIGYFSFRSPNGLIARSLGVLPIEVNLLNKKELIKVDYAEPLTFSEPTIIKSRSYVITSNSISAILDDQKINNLTGVAYIYVTENTQATFGKETIQFEIGEYVVNSSPVSIHVLRGSAAINQLKANSDQVLINEVDRFAVKQPNKTLYTSNTVYVRLIELLKNQGFLPKELTDFTTGQNFEPVAEVEEENPIQDCTDLVTEDTIICLINNLRIENNLNTLEINNTLLDLSASHAVWMNNNQSLSTVESNGLSYRERCANAQVECYAEINIGISAPSAALNIFNKIADNHKSILLNNDISRIGLSISGEYLSMLIQ